MYRKRKRPTPGLGIQPPYNPIRGDYADLRKEGIVSRVAIMRVLEIKDDYLVCCGYDPESMRFLNSVNVAKPYLCRTTLADEFVSHSQTRNYFEGELIVAVKPRTALGDTPGQAIDPQELDDFGYSRYEVMLDEEDNPIWWMELAGGGGGGGDIVPIELLDDLVPCGSAWACSLDLSTNPPTANYLDSFLVEDFFGLSGLIGYRGWAKKVKGGSASSGSGSDAPDVYKLVNLGPPCASGSESSGSDGSGSDSSGSESSGSESSGSESSGSGSESSSSGSCITAESLGFPPHPGDGEYVPAFDPNGCFYWKPLQSCGSISGAS